jgi:hypothetical protein
VKEGTCNQVKSCIRCKFEESRSEHIFEDTGERHEVTMTPPGTDWEMRYKATMLRCRRCGKVERKLLGAV